MNKLQKIGLIAIIVLAIFFRFYLVWQMPGGLFPDEAANGLDINLMAQGHFQPFYERGNGREALFFYLLAASVDVFGRGPWQHHIVSAMVGIFSVILCFLLTKKLFQLFGGNRFSQSDAINMGLFAAFFMAVNTWHVVLSRTAFRAILIPLFTTAAILALLYVYETVIRNKTASSQESNNDQLSINRSPQTPVSSTQQSLTTSKILITGLAAGAIFALGWYTYIAYRIMVPFLAIALVYPALALWRYAGKAALKPYLKPLLYFIIAFVIVFAPLGYYFYSHPGSFVGRSSQVSIFSPDLNHGDLKGTLIEVTQKSLLAYLTDGDLNWRHNVSGFPFLSPLISLFFVFGMILVLVRAIRYIFFPIRLQNHWKYFLLAGWFWSMLIPVVTTAEGIPHGLRSIGTIPAVFIITALGFYEVVKTIKWLIAWRLPQMGQWRTRIITVSCQILLACFIATLITQSYIAYFVYAANDPENFYSFRSDLTVVSDYLKDHGDKQHTYLILDKFSIQTVDYLTTVRASEPNDPRNQPYTQVDPENSWQLPKLQPGDQVVFTQSSIFDTMKFTKYHPEVTLIKQTYNKFGQKIMIIYQAR